MGTLVFVHGFSAHIGNFRHLGRACADAGLATTLFDCRGHGRSQGRRGHVNRFSEFVEDLDLIIGGARARHPTLPLALAGHSHGALICLEYALQPPGRVGRAGHAPAADVRSLVLTAPFLGLRLRVPLFKRALARPLGTLWPTLALANGVKGADVSRTAEAVAGFNADPLVHHVATSRWFNEVRAAQAHALAAAGSLRVPTLIQMAGQDRLVSNQATLAFAKAAGAAVQTRGYDNLFHEMFLEPERDQVMADLIQWTRARLTAGTALETMAP